MREKQWAGWIVALKEWIMTGQVNALNMTPAITKPFTVLIQLP